MDNLKFNVFMDLSNKKCVPCEGGVPPLTPAEVSELKKSISAGWVVLENKKIQKEFSFVNFKHTMEFVNSVADLAEEQGHHPDMQVHYGKVIVEFWTHAINGLSENDFIMAARIDKL